MRWRGVIFMLGCLLAAVPVFSEEQGSKETDLRPGPIDLHTVEPRRVAEVSFPERTATTYQAELEWSGFVNGAAQPALTRPLGLTSPQVLWVDPKELPDPEVLKREALEQLRQQNLKRQDEDPR